MSENILKENLQVQDTAAHSNGVEKVVQESHTIQKDQHASDEAGFKELTSQNAQVDEPKTQIKPSAIPEEQSVKPHQRTLEEIRAEEEGNDSAEEAFPETLVDKSNSSSNNRLQSSPNKSLSNAGSSQKDGEQGVKNSAINQYNLSRKERQQAELNSQQLANRISLLKQEEVKTLKKIEETRKKAMEIYYLKLKNQKKSQVKLVAAEVEMTQKREKVTQLRVASMESKKTNKEIYDTMKMDNVRKVKEAKALNEKKIEEKRLKQGVNARERNENVRMQREQLQQRIQEFQREKQEMIKKETIEKTQKEDKVKLHKQKELKRMELLEMDIIQRLQSTQQMQKHAYEELESALLLNTKDFYSKYLEKEVQAEQEAVSASKSQNSNNRFADDRSQQSITRSESQPHATSNKDLKEPAKVIEPSTNQKPASAKIPAQLLNEDITHQTSAENKDTQQETEKPSQTENKTNEKAVNAE